MVLPFTKTFSLSDNLKIRIKRVPKIENNEFYKTIPIQNSAFFHYGSAITEDPLRLPKMYSALTLTTGESDQRYDHYKGSYSFMFELDVQKNNNTSKYYYHIHHYRSYIEFGVYHIVPKNDPRESYRYCQPNDTLFSDDDICHFTFRFSGYLFAYLKHYSYKPIPFVKHSQSNLLLFGYANDEYFYEEFEDQDKFADTFKKYLQLYKNSKPVNS